MILDTNKITIGMCGSMCERKNYKLFIEVSKHFPNYNFLWIGDTQNIFDNYQNIFHIKSTHNPKAQYFFKNFAARDFRFYIFRRQ